MWACLTSHYPTYLGCVTQKVKYINEACFYFYLFTFLNFYSTKMKMGKENMTNSVAVQECEMFLRDGSLKCSYVMVHWNVPTWWFTEMFLRDGSLKCSYVMVHWNVPTWWFTRKFKIKFSLKHESLELLEASEDHMRFYSIKSCRMFDGNWLYSFYSVKSFQSGP